VGFTKRGQKPTDKKQLVQSWFFAKHCYQAWQSYLIFNVLGFWFCTLRGRASLGEGRAKLAEKIVFFLFLVLGVAY